MEEERKTYEWIRETMRKANQKYRNANRERFNQMQKNFYEAHKEDEAYMQKNAALLQAAPLVNDTLKELADFRKMRTMYESASNEMLGMTGKERREAIDELKGYELQAVSQVRQIEKMIRDNQ